MLAKPLRAPWPKCSHALPTRHQAHAGQAKALSLATRGCRRSTARPDRPAARQRPRSAQAPTPPRRSTPTSRPQRARAPQPRWPRRPLRDQGPLPRMTAPRNDGEVVGPIGGVAHDALLVVQVGLRPNGRGRVALPATRFASTPLDVHPWHIASTRDESGQRQPLPTGQPCRPRRRPSASLPRARWHGAPHWRSDAPLVPPDGPPVHLLQERPTSAASEALRTSMAPTMPQRGQDVAETARRVGVASKHPRVPKPNCLFMTPHSGGDRVHMDHHARCGAAHNQKRRKA